MEEYSGKEILTQKAVAMFISICRASRRVISFPRRIACSATFRLVGLRNSSVSRVFTAHCRTPSSVWLFEILASSAKISSTALCLNAESSATRFAPTNEVETSSASRSADSCSMMSLIVLSVGSSRAAMRSNRAAMRLEGT